MTDTPKRRGRPAKAVTEVEQVAEKVETSVKHDAHAVLAEIEDLVRKMEHWFAMEHGQRKVREALDRIAKLKSLL